LEHPTWTTSFPPASWNTTDGEFIEMDASMMWERPMSCTAITIISAMVGVFVGALGGALATALVASGKPRNEDNSHHPPTQTRRRGY
jgi:hypothetical protein